MLFTFYIRLSLTINQPNFKKKKFRCDPTFFLRNLIFKSTLDLHQSMFELDRLVSGSNSLKYEFFSIQKFDIVSYRRRRRVESSQLNRIDVIRIWRLCLPHPSLLISAFDCNILLAHVFILEINK